MSLSQSGTTISDCNITSINDLGLWVLVNETEYFIPFADYPGFKGSSVDQVFKVRWLKPSQLRWDELDIDIELGSLSKPESFPLIFKK